jgi:hypothetical protein
MSSVVAELEHLSKLASADSTKRFSRLYRLVRDTGLLAIAADRHPGGWRGVAALKT